MIHPQGTRRFVTRRAILFVLAMFLIAIAPGYAWQDSASTNQGAAAVPAYRQANKVAVLPVRGIIDHVTLRSLERRIDRAVREGATGIVLDIDTPGGELNATLDICHLLKTDAPANTVAWINPQAYSAGTIIALATREIVVQENASFGDAAPIAVLPLVGLQQLPAAERAKLESPILEEVVNSARRNHYDEKLVQAFVSVGVELWLVEHRDTGDHIFVDRAEYRTIFGEDPPQQLTGVTPDFTSGDRVSPYVDESIPRREREQAEGQEAEFRQQLPSSRPTLTEADRGNYKVIRQVTAADRLLTLRPDEAIFYGLAAEVIRNDEELQAYFGAQELVRYDPAWSEAIARFLMSFPVRAVLIIVFLVGLFIELSAPGLGVFGAAAAVALLLLLSPPYLMGMAQWWGILLIAIGLILLATELFLIPGTGIAGVLGLLSLMLGMIGTFVTGDMSNMPQYQIWAIAATTLTAVFAAGVIIWLVSRQFHSMPVLERIILKSELRKVPERVHQPADGTQPDHQLQVGDIGVAHTGLRPAGRGMFDDRIVDVQSLGGYIEQGTPIQIVSIGKYVIEVEEVEE